MNRPSFSRTYAADGWRYAVGARTKPVSIDGIVWWRVEKWDGENWVLVGSGKSYDAARTIASRFGA